jgi:uncharacterized membrane protein YgaE (UPF0421/DUF939 family)
MTLFALMVVNNWMVITEMYVAASADDGYNGKYARFYFGLFYYFAVIIGINITVAFIIDMYSSVERLDAERSKTLELLESEMKESEANTKFDILNDRDKQNEEDDETNDEHIVELDSDLD